MRAYYRDALIYNVSVEANGYALYTDCGWRSRQAAHRQWLTLTYEGRNDWKFSSRPVQL